MRREAAQVQPLPEGPALEPLQVVVGLVLHLAVQDLHAVEAQLGSQVDAGFEVAEIGMAKLPEGIGRDGQAGTASGGASGSRLLTGNR
jgi:hypothetical protein